jgi:hypothetical protein
MIGTEQIENGQPIISKELLPTYLCMLRSGVHNLTEGERRSIHELHGNEPLVAGLLSSHHQ